ncbi:MAG TPA: branched-chain amino acid ABC transporter permease [Solirubrobacterales bacterium]|jgi:branched-chain amino acid transport system permease protein
MTLVQVLINGVVLGSTFALMAVGLTLIFGILRVINFTHGVLFMLGAYATWFLETRAGIPYLVSVPLAALAVGAFGVALELLVLRRFRGMLVEGAVVALALAVVIQNAAVLVLPSTPQTLTTPFDSTISSHGVVLSSQRAFIVVAAFALLTALALFISRTRLGRAVRALEQNVYAARLQGVDPDRVAPLVFGIGATLAGLAGALIAPLQALLPGAGDQPLLASFVVVVLGGMGSVGGTLVAALTIGIVQSGTTTYWTAPAAVATSFVLAIVVLVVRPQGFFGNA